MAVRAKKWESKTVPIEAAYAFVFVLCFDVCGFLLSESVDSEHDFSHSWVVWWRSKQGYPLCCRQVVRWI